MSTVRIQNAHKYYNRGKSNQLHVMDDVNLELPESGLVAIFGQSGCGKTTLLNAVGGLDKIQSGRIEIFGQSIRENTDTLRNRYIGYIFQNYNLDIGATVYENVASALRLCGMTDEATIRERVLAALAGVGLERYVSRTPDTLSGGQQQRVAIARALVKNPAIILADEPTGNLDETNTVLVMDILKEISRTHLVLLVTHEESLVDHYCDRVIEIVDGRIMGDRQNQGANGYIQRNKNDIYLGELAMTETATPGVTVEYYGDTPARALTLRIVHIGGKLYLKTDDPTVKLLDEGSEIQLKEGVFVNTPPTPEEGKGGPSPLDMSVLPPVEGAHYGRLWHWRNATVAAIREHFTKKRKAGNKLLRTCLFLLAVVLVFMTAIIGSGLSGYVEAREEHNPALFYIPLDSETDYTALNAAMGQHGMDFARLIGMDPTATEDSLSVKGPAFVTAQSINLTTDATAVSLSDLPTRTAVAGTTTPTASTDIVITSALADDLIESADASYIDTYEDLVSMICPTYVGYGRSNLRIVGVISSDERFYYMDSILLSDKVINSYFYLPVTNASNLNASVKPAAGEVIHVYEAGFAQPSYKVGDTVYVLGMALRVSAVLPYTYEYEDNVITEWETEIPPLSEDTTTEDTPGVSFVDGNFYEFILSDEDYGRLAGSVGRTDVTAYNLYEVWGNMHYNHLMIRSSDPAATEAFLNSRFGADGFYSPDDILEQQLSEVTATAVSGGISILVVLGLMCLCIFFIMRSSFMSRLREVGIQRAIGVTRRNLTFRFAVETLFLNLVTTVPGFLATTLFITSLSDSMLFSEIFFFPAWLAITLFVIITAAALLFGILPAYLLLRKTPSEILSKYDI